VTICYPLLKYIVDINSNNTGALYYFSGYIGYFVLGYYLRRFHVKISKPIFVTLLLFPISVAAVCKLYHIKTDFYEQFWYLSIFAVMMCVAWFSVISQCEFINRIDGKLRLLIVEFSKSSFGIYLIHIFIMRNVLWHCLTLNWWSQIIITPILTLVVSYFLVKAMAMLPFANYIIGYRKDVN
jgi:surface polysaccharide O-acyltransferase-like enzyme